MIQKAKILVYTDAFSGGGAEEVMSFFSTALKEKYHVLHVAKWIGPKTNKLPYWKISLNKPSLLKSIPNLIYIIHKFKPQVILTSTGHNNIALLFLKVFLFRKTKVIIRESSVASVMNSYTFKGKLINSFLVKPLYKRADKIVVQSTDMFNDLIEKYNLNQFKIIKINNPVLNYVTIENKVEKKNEKKVLLLSIGRFSVEKGHLRMLDILSKLPENYTLQLMGDGLLMDNIKEEAKKLNISNRVLFLGFQQEEEKVNTIINSDVFLQTSFVEGFPNSVLQSILLGVPVVAYNVPGGTKEIISNKNGFLIKDNDMNEMIRVLTTTNWSIFDKQAMREEIEMKFGSNQITKQLILVIDEQIK